MVNLVDEVMENGGPILHNADDWSHVFGPEAAATIAANPHWRVWCAPRPLATGWYQDGEMRAFVEAPHYEGYLPDGYGWGGIFWVAGDPDGQMAYRGAGDTFADSMRKNAAREARLVSNEEIEAALRAHLEPEGIVLEETRYTLAELAAMYRLPWREEG